MAITYLDVRQSEWRATAQMIGGSANITADTLFANTDSLIQKLIEDRNVNLSDGGVISLSANGQTLTFSSNLFLNINQTAAGGAPAQISLGSATVAFPANGYMLYATVNRTSSTATLTTVSSSVGLPTATYLNQDVFLIAIRDDISGGIPKVYFRNGTVVFGGQSIRLGAGSVLDQYFSVGNISDATKQIAFSTGSATTGTQLTLASIATANRTITFPDVTDTVVTLAAPQTLSNKVLATLATNVVTDSTTTGSAATLAAADITVGDVRLTNSSLISVSGIPAGTAGQQLTIQNQTGNTISINNIDSGAATADQIYTGTGAGLSMPATATFSFVYDAIAAKWNLIGVAGSSASFGIPKIDVVQTAGAISGHLFEISTPSSNISVGAVYTNSGTSVTVLNSVTTTQAGWILFTSGVGSVATSGTLTLSSGTGPSTIAYSSVQALATYTPIYTTPLYYEMEMIGAGGTGGNGGNSGTSGGGGGGGGGGYISGIISNSTIYYAISSTLTAVFQSPSYFVVLAGANGAAGVSGATAAPGGSGGTVSLSNHTGFIYMKGPDGGGSYAGNNNTGGIGGAGAGVFGGGGGGYGEVAGGGPGGGGGLGSGGGGGGGAGSGGPAGAGGLGGSGFIKLTYRYQ